MNHFQALKMVMTVEGGSNLPLHLRIAMPFVGPGGPAEVVIALPPTEVARLLNALEDKAERMTKIGHVVEGMVEEARKIRDEHLERDGEEIVAQSMKDEPEGEAEAEA